MSIDCPACSKPIEIPNPREQNAKVTGTKKNSSEVNEPEEKKYSLPIHEGQSEIPVKSKKDNKRQLFLLQLEHLWQHLHLPHFPHLHDFVHHDHCST